MSLDVIVCRNYHFWEFVCAKQNPLRGKGFGIGCHRLSSGGQGIRTLNRFPGI